MINLLFSIIGVSWQKRQVLLPRRFRAFGEGGTMKKVFGQQLEFEPASHEPRENPGVLKKVLFRKEDFQPGSIQMVNWALLPAGKSFALHYHEDMEEVFIILSGKAELECEQEKMTLEPGDAVLIPPCERHRMSALGDEDVQYLVLGNSGNRGGKTVVVPGNENALLGES